MHTGKPLFFAVRTRRNAAKINKTIFGGELKMKTTKTRKNRTMKWVFAVVFAAVMAAGLFGALSLTARPQTAHAETASQLAITINGYSSGTGNLSATASGNTVTVVGTKTGATATLELNINSGVTVLWRASLTGSTASTTGLITLTNTAGTFTVDTGGSVTQTGTGSAIRASATTGSSVVINVAGGAVNSTNSQGIFHFGQNGVINVSSGTVSTSSVAITGAGSNGVINITGGTVSSSTDSAYAINGNGATGAATVINITGGAVSTLGGSASTVYSLGTINIMGGEISATSGYGVRYGGELNISGGEISVTAGGTGISATSNNSYARITGGRISATTGIAVYVLFTDSSVHIMGGEISAATGTAVYCSGTVTVSQADKRVPTLITSANVSATGGTVRLAGASTVLNVLGDYIKNTAGGNVIYNPLDAKVIIAGAEITSQSYLLEKVYDGTGSVYVFAPNLFNNIIVQWYKDGAEYDGEWEREGSLIRLRAKNVSDSGVYVCAVKNVFDEYESEWVISAGTTVDIMPRAVNVYADAVSMVEGGAAPALTYTHTGLAAGDSFTGALTRQAGTTVGTYNITQGTLALSGNYTLVFAGNVFTIKDGESLTTQDVKKIVTEMFTNGYLNTAVQTIISLNSAGFLKTDDLKAAVISLINSDNDVKAAINALLTGLLGRLDALENDVAALDRDITELYGLIEDIALTPGADGKSAFALWQEQAGNAGKTLDDFFMSLKGAAGTNGTNGTDGKDGSDGTNGAAVTGIVIGTAGLLTGGVAVALLLLKKKKIA